MEKLLKTDSFSAKLSSLSGFAKNILGSSKNIHCY
jgi:hypothetical protein